MSVFSGPQSPGAMQQHRAKKRAEADERNAATPTSRRRQTRLQEAARARKRKGRRK